MCGAIQHGTVAVNQTYGIGVYFCPEYRSYVSRTASPEVRVLIEKFYRDNYWSIHHVRGQQSFSERLVHWAREHLPVPRTVSHYRFLKPYLSPGMRILEIGAGKGENSFFYLNRGYQVHTVEPDPELCAIMNRYAGRQVATAGLFENVILSGRFDLVYSAHSFEHLLAPEKFLQHVKGNLVPGGLVFIETPNAYYYEHRSEPITELISHTHDMHFFSGAALRHLFERDGFEVLALEEWRESLRGSPSLLKKIWYYGKALLGQDGYAPEAHAENIRILGRWRG